MTGSTEKARKEKRMTPKGIWSLERLVGGMFASVIFGAKTIMIMRNKRKTKAIPPSSPFLRNFIPV